MSSVDNVKNVYTFSFAAKCWGLEKSTLRHAARRGTFEKHLLQYKRDYVKLGEVWLITDMAMRKLYGPPPNPIEIPQKP